MKPKTHPECGRTCRGPHPDFCQVMSDCQLWGSPIVLKRAKKPRKLTSKQKDARIEELEEENRRLKRELSDERNRRDYEHRRKHPLICRS